MRTKKQKQKEKARDRRFAKGFGKFLEDDPDEEDKARSEAESAFYGLPRKVRDIIRAKYKDKGGFETYEAWLAKGTDKWAKRARRASKTQTQNAKGRARHVEAKALTRGSSKMLDKRIRIAMKMPKPPSNPYAALLQPMVIVPAYAVKTPVIADAGSIVRLADQRTLYREWTSPITHRADEILVLYGNAKAPMLGWITQMVPSKALKPTKGPTYLVTTKAEDALPAWEQVRLKIARMRKSDPTIWVARWLATHGSKHPRLLREVTRFFGGKPIKNEAFDDRCMRLFTLILKTELDMATAKKGKSKKSKKAKEEKPTVKTKKNKTAKKKSRVSNDRITKDHDEHVIKRLVKENPRRAGSKKAKVWEKLKKGMTVGEFVAKGGARSVVKYYVQNGWVKLLKPKGE